MTRVIATKTWLRLGLCGALAFTSGAAAADRVAPQVASTQASLTSPWTQAASMSQVRHSHTATLLPNGKVLVASGATSELYDPATNTWSATGNLNTARGSHKAVLLPNGKVLVFGGLGASSNPLKSAELYNPATGTWTATGSLSTAGGISTATLLGSGHVLAISAEGTTAVAAEVYNPSTGTWSLVAAPPAFYRHAAVLLPSGAVLATGQETGQYDSGAWLYWPEDDYWEYVAYANETRRRGHSLTLLPSGRVLVARGTRNQIGGSAELFDPDYNSMDVIGWDSPTTGHTATLLPSGQVLVVGGTSQEEPELYSSAELFTEP